MRRKKLLLVEDSDSDAFLTERAFAHLPIEWVRARDGEEALAVAFTQGPFDLVLLDLNLPRVRGDEVLRQLKRSPLTRRTPVIVLSTSDAPLDVATTFDAGAAGYFVKPLPLRFAALAEILSAYWFDFGRLPP